MAVVARAAQLAGQGFDFSTVVRRLQAEGNGEWPRKTLMRRVRSTSSSSSQARGQKSPATSAAAGAGELLERVAKTDPLERLEAAVERTTYGTPAYHRAAAALHRAQGPCGCYSCGVVKRERRA